MDIELNRIDILIPLQSNLRDEVVNSLVNAIRNEGFEMLSDNKIGSGRIGHVYEARNLQNQQIVAAKCFSDQNRADNYILQYQQLENTPNVCRLMSAHGKTGSASFFMMKKYETNLRQYPLKHNLTFETIITLALQMAYTLRSLLEQNIMHLNIKPSNIFYDYNTLSFKLADFSFDRDQIPRSEFLNLQSKQYMAPELARQNQRYSCSADIYSLGVILLQLTRSFTLTSDQLLSLHQSKENINGLLNTSQRYVEFNSILKSMLVINQNNRITPDNLISQLEHIRNQGQIINQVPAENKGLSSCEKYLYRVGFGVLFLWVFIMTIVHEVKFNKNSEDQNDNSDNFQKIIDQLNKQIKDQKDQKDTLDGYKIPQTIEQLSQKINDLSDSSNSKNKLIDSNINSLSESMKRLSTSIPKTIWYPTVNMDTWVLDKNIPSQSKVFFDKYSTITLNKESIVTLIGNGHFLSNAQCHASFSIGDEPIAKTFADGQYYSTFYFEPGSGYKQISLVQTIKLQPGTYTFRFFYFCYNGERYSNGQLKQMWANIHGFGYTILTQELTPQL